MDHTCLCSASRGE